MNEFLKKLFTSEVKEIRQPFTSSQIVNQNRFSLAVDKNEQSYLKEYKNWVYACINARAEELASIDLKLEDERTDKEIEKHEVLDLLNDVNPNMTRYQLFFATQAFLDLTGNAFWYLARDNDGKGKIKQIFIVSPEKMSIVTDKDNPLTVMGYMYKNGKESIPFGANEIIHFKNFNAQGNFPNPHKGTGVVESALWAIETDNESRTWNYSFFKNSAKPDGILTTETSLTAEQFANMKATWNQVYGGSAKNGKTAILENGLKWQDISKTQKDMDFVAQRTFSRDEILSIFRVPKTVVGITDDVNRANAEASDYVFAKRTVKPLMRAFVTVLNEYLLPEYGTGLHFDFEDPVPEDRLATLQNYSLGINKWLTRNDIRREEGLIPSDAGDVFYAPFSEAPQDSVKVTTPVKSQTPVSKSKTDEVIDAFIAKLPIKKELRKATDSQKSVYKDVFLKRFDANEKALKADVVAYFNAQEKEVLANLESEYNGLKPKEYKFKAVEDIIFDKKKAVATGISLITPHIKKFLEEGAEMADNISGGEYNPNDVASLKFVQERAKFFATSITDTTAEKLLTSIKDSLDAGADFNTIKEGIQAVFTEATESRSVMITRTEVSASLNEGAIQSYKQAGVESTEWIATSPCEVCAENDGVVVKIGDAFPTGDTQPPQHPNCQCTVVGVFNY